MHTNYFVNEGQSYLVVVAAGDLSTTFPQTQRWLAKSFLFVVYLCHVAFQRFPVMEGLNSHLHHFTPPQNWGIHHLLSSAAYSQLNGRVELAVKSAKPKPFNWKTWWEGQQCATSAILQLHNTPIQDLGLAQILFHRQLRDPMLNLNHPVIQKMASLG